MKKKEFTLPEGITLTEQEQAIVDALIAEFNAINEKIDELAPGEDAPAVEEAVAEEMAKALKGIEGKFADSKKFAELEAAMKAQGLVIATLNEQSVGAVRAKTLGQQFAEYVGKNPEELAKVRKGQGNFVMNVKAAANMVPSTHITGTLPAAEREPGFTDVAREKRFLMDIIGSQPTTSPTIEYVEKTNPDGTAIFVADTAAFAQIDFDQEVSSSAAKDTGAYITVHENMLSDIPFMQGEIDGELMYKIKLSADVGIFSGDGTGAKLTGITASAAAFSLLTIQISTPTIWDAVSAALRQIELTGFDEANFIWMNPGDYENALGSKDSQGRYNAHPSLSPDGTRFAGIPIDRSSLITADYLLVGNKMKSNIRILQDIELVIGYNLTGEFVKRQVTVRGSMRMHHYMKDNEVSSFVYDQITDIIAAITKV